MERLAKDKRCGLFAIFVSYKEKSLEDIAQTFISKSLSKKVKV
jgi:hypothetical protein